MKPNFYWYIAQPDELLIDVDHYNPNAPPLRLVNLYQRLLAVMQTGTLDVTDVYLFPSGTEKHYHVFIRLATELDPLEALVWEGYFRDDRFRNTNNLMRHRFGVVSSLLISPSLYPLYRKPDYTCSCTQKHDHATMLACPVANELRGEHAAVTYFPKPKAAEFDVKTFGRLSGLPYRPRGPAQRSHDP